MLRQLPSVSDPNLLVGFSSGDDAAIYKLSDNLALVHTVDFFPPIVDDPFTFGEIAVANAVSDVYAMGGTPLLGLNIVGFPSDLPTDILGNILRGGASKAAEAGMIIGGGHTIIDTEPKYGMAVTGIVAPGKQITNAGAKVGDSLVLTKAIGTGIITTAAKNQKATPNSFEKAVESMLMLNQGAAKAMIDVGVNACVDITGFGLIGHLLGMLGASKVSAYISNLDVPVLEGTLELLDQNMVPDGTHRNLQSADHQINWGPISDKQTKLLLCDPQTSGGLLISVSPEKKDILTTALEKNGVETKAVIGEILDLKSPQLQIVR